MEGGGSQYMDVVRFVGKESSCPNFLERDGTFPERCHCGAA